MKSAIGSSRTKKRAYLDSGFPTVWRPFIVFVFRLLDELRHPATILPKIVYVLSMSMCGAFRDMSSSL